MTRSHFSLAGRIRVAMRDIKAIHDIAHERARRRTIHNGLIQTRSMIPFTLVTSSGVISLIP